MKIRVLCPHPDCGQGYRADETHVGHTTVCRRCGREFTFAAAAGDANPNVAGRVPLGSPSRGRAAGPDAQRHGKLGRFEIRGRLGAGAFGEVFRAYDPVLEREVALKILRAAALEQPEARARFLREPKAAAHLRHPHIVPIYDAGRDGQRYYIASAYVQGQTLEDVITDGRLDSRRAAEIVRDLALALDYAHRMGVIHRDVKPANIMLDSSGQPLLMDFGLARLESAAEKLTQDGTLMGTPAYMAPEQADHAQGEVGPASDQYSVGVVLYELLCGQTPFTGPSPVLVFNLLNTAPESPRKRELSIPRDLETICLKALEKRSEDRYASCGELAEDLRRWLADEPIRARHLGLSERTVRWAKRKPLLAGLAAAVALLAVLSSVATVAQMNSQLALAQTLDNEKEQRRIAEEQTRQADELTRLAEERERLATMHERVATDTLAKLQDEEKTRERLETQRREDEEKRKQSENALKQQRVKADDSSKALDQATQQTEELKKQLEAAAAQQEELLNQDPWTKYIVFLSQADGRIQAGQLKEALDALYDCPSEHRAWEWYYLKALCEGTKPEEGVYRLEDVSWNRKPFSASSLGPNLCRLQHSMVGPQGEAILAAGGLTPGSLAPRLVEGGDELSPDGKYMVEFRYGIATRRDIRSGAPPGGLTSASIAIGPKGALRSFPLEREHIGRAWSYSEGRYVCPDNFVGRYFAAFGPGPSYAYLGSANGISLYSLAEKRPPKQIKAPLVAMEVFFDREEQLVAVAVNAGGEQEPQGLRLSVARKKTLAAEKDDWTTPAQMSIPSYSVGASRRGGTERPPWCDFLMADGGQKIVVWPGDTNGYVFSTEAPLPICTVARLISLSPDGRRVTYISGHGQLVLRDVASGADLPSLRSLGWCQQLITGRDEPRFSWDWTRVAIILPECLFYWSMPPAANKR